jgi:hypothetical protein
MSDGTPSPEGTCRSCGAALWWADYVKKDGSPGHMPVDHDPSPDGNIQLFRRANGTVRCVMLTRKQANDMRAAAEAMGTDAPLRRSHFSTCPHANQHRGAP